VQLFYSYQKPIVVEIELESLIRLNQVRKSYTFYIWWEMFSLAQSNSDIHHACAILSQATFVKM